MGCSLSLFWIHYNSGPLFISKLLTYADQQVFAFLLNTWLWQSSLLIRFTVSFIFIVIYFLFCKYVTPTKCDWSKIFVMYIKRLKNICRNVSYICTHGNTMTSLNHTFWFTFKKSYGERIWKAYNTFAPKHDLTGLLGLYFNHPPLPPLPP